MRLTIPLLSVALCAGVVGAMRPPAPMTETISATLNNQWTTVNLPEVPLGITAHGGRLWAVGANEMIAVSSDYGHSWRVVNHAKPGEMLFFMAFLDQPGDKQASLLAFGSGKRMLRSVDGGANWKIDRSEKSNESWSYGEFINSQNGIAGSPSGWGLTSDGGKTWTVHGVGLPAEDALVPPDPKNPVPPVPLLHSPNRRTLTVAALDPLHDAILMAPERGQQPFVFTNDGGKTWNIIDLQSKLQFAATGMRTDAGSYWIYGTDKRGQAVVLTTKDARTWTSNPPLATTYTACNDQGCRIPGGWAQLDQPAIQLWQLPESSASFSTTSWAFAGGTFCRTAAEKLECTNLQSNWSQPPANYRALREIDYRELKPERWAAVGRPSETYDSEGGDTHEGVTLLRMVIGTNGVPESVQIEGTAWGDMGQTVVDELKTWHFAPVIQDERPVEAVVNVPYVLLLGMSHRYLPGFADALTASPRFGDAAH